MTEDKPITIIDYLKIINALPSTELTPTQLKILIALLVRLGKNGKTWIKNKTLSEDTATSYDGIRVRLNELKNKGMIYIANENGLRMIYIAHPTEKYLLRTSNENGKMLLVRNSDVTGPYQLYMKRKGKDHLKEKLLAPLPNGREKHPSLDIIWPKINIVFRRRIKKAYVNNWLWDNNGNSDYIEYLNSYCCNGKPDVRKFQHGLKTMHAAFFKKQESMEVEKKDLAFKETEEAAKIFSGQTESTPFAKASEECKLKYAKEYLDSCYGSHLCGYSLESVIEQKSFESYFNHNAVLGEA